MYTRGQLERPKRRREGLLCEREAATPPLRSTRKAQVPTKILSKVKPTISKADEDIWNCLSIVEIMQRVVK